MSERNDYREKDWDERFAEWRQRKKQGDLKTHEVVRSNDASFVEKIESAAGKSFKEVEQEIEKVERDIKNYVEKTPFHVRIIKVFAVLIPVLIILYLIGANFMVAQDFEYRYDIGSQGETYLAPVERVSSSAVVGETSYRNLTGHLVYFDVPIARGAETVDVSITFKDAFPQTNGRFSLGARDAEEWHYLYKRLYNPSLALGAYEEKNGVYRVNSNLPLVDEVGLLNLEGITVASETFVSTMNVVSDYEKKDTIISAALRGKHVFYIYAAEDLSVEIEKRDINWYDGSDELFIALYDFDGELVEFTQIGDDGVVDTSKAVGAAQKATLRASGISGGVYRLELSDFDGLVTKIKLNSNKIVAEKVFLASNLLYGVNTKPSTLYFDYEKDLTVRFITYHAEGLQTITFLKDSRAERFDFNIEDEPVEKRFVKGKYSASFPKNDIVVESPEYFAFTPSGYFRPFRQKVVGVNSPDWVMDSVDYIMTDYVAPEVSGEWIIARTSFDLEDENLFVNDQGKLSFVFNTPHLAEAGSNFTIPIDIIEVNVHKPGVFG